MEIGTLKKRLLLDKDTHDFNLDPYPTRKQSWQDSSKFRGIRLEKCDGFFQKSKCHLCSSIP